MRPFSLVPKTLGFPLILLLAMSASLFGWSANLHQPPPGQLFVEHLWALDVNNSESQPVDVKLHGWITEAKLGRVFEGTSNVIRLMPGRNRITSQDITRVSQIFRHPDFRDLIIRTGRFPAGQYTEICVEVLRDATLESLATDCIEQRVIIAAPLRLITPKNESVIMDKLPLFQWSVISEADHYRLKLCEVLKGQTPEDALLSNRAWYESRDITGLSLRYPLSERRLEVEKRYAWRVQALLGTHVLITSPVFSFTFGPEEDMITREEAIQMILKRVIVPGSLEHEIIAFLGREPLDEGDTVFQDVEIEVVHAMDGPTWFAWVFDEPTLEFEHETRYVFIDAVTGELVVRTRNWWPLLNRRLIWNTQEELKGDQYVFFRNMSE
jgi:hypothetical protein